MIYPRFLSAVLSIFASAVSFSIAADPVASVDPKIGVYGPGSCMPGPCLPNSSIYPSPDTASPHDSGYLAGEGVVGFSQLHTQGTGGIPSYGNFLVSPQIGLATKETDHASPISNEHATATRYDVRLDRYGIDCSVTPSRHSAVYQFQFPKSPDARVLIDVARKIGASNALVSGSVTVDAAASTISGGGRFAGNWAQGEYPLFFFAKFSRKPTSAGTWKDSDISETASASGTKQPLGAWFGFDTRQDATVEMKIAVSFKSVEQARKWLEDEIPAWDFAATESKAKAVWNEALGRVDLPGASGEERRKFYTALWHSLVQPRDRTGDSAENLSPFWDDHYTLWDSWKTLFPLLAIVRPEVVRDNVNSFIVRHQAHGYAATAFIQGREYKVGQGGDEADNIIADAFVKKIPGVDWDAAYAMLQSDAEKARTANYRDHGYVSENRESYCYRMRSGSGTLAFAYNDFAVSEVAKGLGRQPDAERYAARSKNWKNVWDESLKDGDFQGFPRARAGNGVFSKTPARAGYNTDFYEATCWVASYAPTFAIPELVATMGGKKKFIDRLVFGLNHDLIDFSNEPSFMTIWLLAAVDRPYLASYWADVLRKKFHDTSLPGDEDQGAMSSLYVFLTAGLFPFAAQDIYYLHGPRVPEVAFHLGNGKTFTILGRNVSPENLYVQSAMLNGKPLDHAWIRHGDILDGGKLEFVMGPKPSAWGTAGEFDAAEATAQLVPQPQLAP